MGQISRHSLAGLSISESLTRLHKGWGLVRRLTWGRICFQTHFHGCWQDSIPWGSLDREPQFFATCTSNHLEACFTKPSKSCLARWKSLPYHDSDIFHCLCSIPLVRSKAQMSPTLKGRGLRKGVTTRRSQKLLILEDAAVFISVPWISRKL